MISWKFLQQTESSKKYYFLSLPWAQVPVYVTIEETIEANEVKGSLISNHILQAEVNTTSFAPGRPFITEFSMLVKMIFQTFTSSAFRLLTCTHFHLHFWYYFTILG